MKRVPRESTNGDDAIELDVSVKGRFPLGGGSGKGRIPPSIARFIVAAITIIASLEVLREAIKVIQDILKQ